MKIIKQSMRSILKFVAYNSQEIIVKKFICNVTSIGLIGTVKSFLRNHYLQRKYGKDWYQIMQIVSSKVFDESFYLDTYLDVKNAGVNPLVHYYYHGWKEGRNPCKMFDTKFYMDRYGLQVSLENPLYHYIRIGNVENLPISLLQIQDETIYYNHYFINQYGKDWYQIMQIMNSGLFGYAYYLDTYPDVKNAGVNPLVHYYYHGCKEGRNPSENFDTIFYMSKYKVQIASENPLIHYIRVGNHENLFINFLQMQNEFVNMINSGEKHVGILTTHHCIFVANLIKNYLLKIDFTVDIIFSRPSYGFTHNLYYVICPQFFPELPDIYVAFQMEQSVNSRWFTADYFRALKYSIAIFEYSLTNVEYLLNSDLLLQQIFYLPICYFPNYISFLNLPEDSFEEYDVVFYGDIKNTRRQCFINEISQKYKVKILNEVFGNDLIHELRKARVIINIHYYEGALLETTRIYECLSLDKLVISESASDMIHHAELSSIVDFVGIGDMAAMANRVDYWVSNTEIRLQKIVENKTRLEKLSNKFSYFFYRFMLAKDMINYQKFYSLSCSEIKIGSDFWCLSLPESQDRRRDFIQDNQYLIQIFNGMRHNIGWIGCALSFKTMINKAKDLNLNYVIICEDDVEFYPDFNLRLNSILRYLTSCSDKWDIFSGFIADLHQETHVLAIEQYENEEFIYIDKIISMVFNVYNRSCFDTLLNWDEQNRDVATNTIDKYLESNNDLRYVTVNPFLVGHKEKLNSTLWGINNLQYNKLITSSIDLLEQKIHEFNENIIKKLC